MSIYDFNFQATGMNGQSQSLKDYKGQVVMIVNTASNAVLLINMKIYRNYMIDTKTKDSSFQDFHRIILIIKSLEIMMKLNPFVKSITV